MASSQAAFDPLQYAEAAFSSIRNISTRTVRSALFHFASVALPSVMQLADSYHPQTAIQRQLAVLPLPFDSRGFLQPWYTTSEQQTLFHKDRATFIELFDSRAEVLVDAGSNVIVLIESKDEYSFAHEAPVYFSDRDELYFCSDAGGKGGRSDRDTNNAVFRIHLNETILRARDGVASFEQDVETLAINSDSVQMTNGGTPYHDQLLLINSGRTEKYPPSLTLIDRDNVSHVQTLLNNAFGRQFNALNDVKVNFHRGSIFFTDASYGQSQNFRPETELPKAVWRFDPLSGRLTMLDASITTPNGLAFSKDGHKLYVTDTGAFPGGGLPNIPQAVPSAIYEFDVVYKKNTEVLQNRRLFAYVPTGVADGINVDNHGNVYSCLADGLYVWDEEGLLLMRIFLGQTCYNFTFAGRGRILIMADTHLYLAQLAPGLDGPALDSYPRADRRKLQAFDT